MTVYFVQAEKSRFVKIGHTTVRPEDRIRNLQTAHSEKLILLRVVPGGSSIERAYHAKFAAQHIRGEWFVYDSAMLTEGPPSPPPRPKMAIKETLKSNGSELAKKIYELGLFQCWVGEKLGIPRAHFCLMMHGKRPLHEKHIAPLAKILGIKEEDVLRLLKPKYNLANRSGHGITSP